MAVWECVTLPRALASAAVHHTRGPVCDSAGGGAACGRGPGGVRSGCGAWGEARRRRRMRIWPSGGPAGPNRAGPGPATNARREGGAARRASGTASAAGAQVSGGADGGPSPASPHLAQHPPPQAGGPEPPGLFSPVEACDPTNPSSPPSSASEPGVGHPKALSFPGPPPPHGDWTTGAERRGFGRVKASDPTRSSVPHRPLLERAGPLSLYTPERPELQAGPGRELAKC